MIQNSPIEDFGRYRTALEELDADVALIRAYEGDRLPGPEAFDLILVGGTPISANDAEKTPYLASLMQFLDHAIQRNVVCFGICCGAQLLARLLGGRVLRAPVKEIGCYDVRLTDDGKSDPLFTGFPETFPVFHWHGDIFMPPKDGHALVTAVSCPDQAFRRGHVAGVLFHLEFDHAAVEHWADAYASELVDEKKTRQQLLSEVRSCEDRMKPLARRLMENLLVFVD